MLESVKTQEASRPDLADMPVNGSLGYIGSQIYPVMPVQSKAGTYYYRTLEADVDADTTRSPGVEASATTLAESSSTFSAAERIDRQLVPYEMVPLIGGVEGSDKRGGLLAKRNVMNSIETAQLAAFISGAGSATITSAIVDGIIDALNQVDRYAGRSAVIMNVGQYRWMIQQTEIKNLLVRSFGGLSPLQAMSLQPAVFKAMLQGLFGVDEVLIADDKWWPYAYRLVCAVAKIPATGDELSFMTDAELGRTMIYWPTGATSPYEVNSFPDDNVRGNKYDAIVWDSIEQFNAGAKVLLTISTSGSTT